MELTQQHLYVEAVMCPSYDCVLVMIDSNTWGQRGGKDWHNGISLEEYIKSEVQNILLRPQT